MAEEAEQIGKRIRELRLAPPKMTQRELAAKLPGQTEGKDVAAGTATLPDNGKCLDTGAP